MFKKVEKGEKVRQDLGSLESAAIRLTLKRLQYSPCQFHVYVSLGTLESDLLTSEK